MIKISNEFPHKTSSQSIEKLRLWDCLNLEMANEQFLHGLNMALALSCNRNKP